MDDLYENKQILGFGDRIIRFCSSNVSVSDFDPVYQHNLPLSEEKRIFSTRWYFFRLIDYFVLTVDSYLI